MDAMTKNKLREIQSSLRTRADNRIRVTPEEFDSQVLVGKLDGTCLHSSYNTATFLVNYSPTPICFADAVDVIYSTPDAMVIDYSDVTMLENSELFSDDNDAKLWFWNDFVGMENNYAMDYTLVMIRTIHKLEFSLKS